MWECLLSELPALSPCCQRGQNKESCPGLGTQHGGDRPLVLGRPPLALISVLPGEVSHPTAVSPGPHQQTATCVQPLQPLHVFKSDKPILITQYNSYHLVQTVRCPVL